MKCLPALTKKPLWLLAILLFGTLGVVGRSWDQPPAPARVQEHAQVGFYDLMSQQQEVYDTQLEHVDHAVLVTISSPDNHDFLVKGKFSEVARQHGKILFDFLPVYCSTPKGKRMIDGLMDFLNNNEIALTPLTADSQALIVDQNGMIFLEKG